MQTKQAALPQAYPDELWYSRLARYHRYSGNFKFQTTFNELGLRSSHKHIIRTLNSSRAMLGYYVNRSEQEFWHDIEKNTLDPYSFRYISPEKRRQYYARLWDGKVKNYAILNGYDSVTPKLRYCPLCFQEDIENYGESYWHRLHQNDFFPFCLKHKCYTIPAQIPEGSMVLTKLYCADAITCPPIETITPMTKAEEKLALYVKAILEAPYDYTKVYGLDGIKKILFQRRIALVHKSGRVLFWKQKEIKKEMTDEFGELAQKVFPDTSPTGKKVLLNKMLESRQCTIPERFVMMMALLNVPFDELFLDDNEYLRNDEMVQKIIHMANSPYLFDKARTAAKLNLNSYQMDVLTQGLGIKRFWGPPLSKSTEPRSGITIPVSLQKKIRIRIHELGFYSFEEYLKYAVNYESKHNPDGLF